MSSESLTSNMVSGHSSDSSPSSSSPAQPVPPASVLPTSSSLPPILPSSPAAHFGSPPTIGEKLTGQNFQIWKTQITPYLQAAGLLSVIDGSEPSPPPHIPHPSNSSTTIPNPAYLSWLTRDSIARGWILNSSTSPVVAQLTQHQTAAAIWTYLGESYAAQSAARASSLRLQFQSITKGHRTVTEFLQEAASIANQLAAIGEPLSANEYHTSLFRGLGPDFARLDTAISVLSQTGGITRDALHGLLLQHEGRLDLAHLTTPTPAAAFISQHGPGRSAQRTTSRPHTWASSPPASPSPQSAPPAHLGSPHQSPLLPTPSYPPNYKSSMGG